MTSAIRVLHVVVAGDIGGAERLLVDLGRRPQASGAEHVVALMTPNEALLRYFRDAGLEVVDRGRVRENPAAYLWRSFGRADVAWLEETMRREKADVAHLHTFASHVVGLRAARRAGIPALRTEHHVQYFLDWDTRYFTRWSLARVDAVVAISDYVRDFVARLEPSVVARMRVVRNGVDADYFAPRPAPTGGAADAPFTFVVVCRLVPWKGVDLVIEAMHDVPAAHLHVVGDGPERARLEARAASLGRRVRFLGYQKDPRDCFAAADAVINSSREEPLGLSVLEAESMARPVIAFAGGGVPEVVKNGTTGWLVPERSVAPLARAMRDAASSRARAQAMGAAARALVESEHRIERMCAGYAECYARLARS